MFKCSTSLELQSMSLFLSSLTGREVAFNRATSASTTFTSAWNPHNAVDGRVLATGETADSTRTCFASGNEQQPWWQLDLDTAYSVQDVYFYGRLSNLGEHRTKQIAKQINHSHNKKRKTRLQ